jgi:serine/threonine protein kinase
MNEKELLGVTLGNCTIERMIGKGGMALVFLAQQARPTRTVAIKVLLPSIGANDPDQQQIFLERFRREADTIARLEHKNILPVYEYEEAAINGQRLAYLVMPYVRGGTLRQHMDDRKHSGQPYDLPTVSSYVNQMADALNYAHNLGIVHRDIKPSNLLFHSDGRLLLSDFGIVRLNALPALTLTGSFIGTAEYASPEQISAGELDARSDIYALGVILYEMLTGDVPFTGPTPFAVMAKHLHNPVPSVRAQRPDLSPAVEFVVKKALAKDPKDRYQQAAELAADLQAATGPALVGGLRLSGDAVGNSDMTVADAAWRPPVARVIAPTVPVERAASAAAPQDAPSIPPTQKAYPVTQLPRLPSVAPPPAPTKGAFWQKMPFQKHLPQVAPVADESKEVKTYRFSRRLAFLSISLISLILQFLILGLFVNHTQFGDKLAAISLGVLLGNGLNLLSLVAIGFTSVTRPRNLRKTFNRVLWIMLLALVLSGFFISYGQSSATDPSQFSPTNLPLISYIILLLSNIFSLRELSKVDVARERIESAPIAWRAALVGALTGLIPLIIIIIFAVVVMLANNTLFLRLLGILVIGFIGAPTPGAMMAAWLSRKMSFPILIRTSAIAGLFMFLAAYTLIIVPWLASGQHPLDWNQSFTQQQQILPLVIIGACLGLIGLLRGMLDAWVYYWVTMRRKPKNA